MKKFLLLFCAVALVGATSGMVSANTIASSTMWFSGSLTDAGGGVLTGTVDAIAGTYYAPGGPGTTWDGTNWRTPDGSIAVGGFDVYAKEGGTAYYDDAVQGTIGSDHDAYSSGGGWGAFWDPDVPDWDHYQLTLTATDWYLEYKGPALGTPMSGTIDWANMYALETGTGSYRGTVPADPDANDGDAALNGGGPGAWDMDWTWGSEAIPLEYPGFALDIVDLSGGQYKVSMTPTPVPEPATMLLLGSGLIGLAGFRRRFR